MKKLRVYSQGIGLLELMLVLLVITFILFGALRFYKITLENARLAQGEEMINNLTAASYKWAASSSDLGQLTLQTLINMDLIPENYINHPWNGPVAVSGTQPNTVRITFENMKQTDCTALALKMQNYVKNPKTDLGCQAANPYNFYIIFGK